MAFTQVTLKGDQRWDNIAQAAYGDVSQMPLLMGANPDVPLDDIIPSGTVLKIPILDSAVDTTDYTLYPPWKQ